MLFLTLGGAMRHRGLIHAFAFIAVMWPLVGYAQQRDRVERIGFLNAAVSQVSLHIVTAFRRGLAETGNIEGQNIAIEYRWAEGHYKSTYEARQVIDLAGFKVVAGVGFEPTTFRL